MSLQQSLQFIQEIRGDSGNDDFAQLAEVDSLDGLLGLAKERGFDLSLSELRAAHKLDWEMRYARFSK